MHLTSGIQRSNFMAPWYAIVLLVLFPASFIMVNVDASNTEIFSIYENDSVVSSPSENSPFLDNSHNQSGSLTHFLLEKTDKDKNNDNNTDTDTATEFVQIGGQKRQIDFPFLITSSFGGLRCKYLCLNEGTNYSWCRIRTYMTNKGGPYNWDYCSAEGYDYKGRQCIDKCDQKQWSMYTTCTVSGRSWGYCSQYNRFMG